MSKQKQNTLEEFINELLTITFITMLSLALFLNIISDDDQKKKLVALEKKVLLLEESCN